jgi:hypothetical protein
LTHLQDSPKVRIAHAKALLPQHHDYLANKAVGGGAGRKGTRYEDYFAAYLLARLLVDRCWNAPPATWPEIYEQLVAFVDDVVTSTDDGVTYYQLKNVAHINWTSGEHPLATDFELQMQLAQSYGDKAPTTVLVVPDVALTDTLIKKVPASIKGHTSVEYFPYCGGSLKRIAVEFDQLRNALEQLVRVASHGAKVTDDELEYTYGALVQSFMHRSQADMTVRELLRCARKTSPSLVRLLPHEAAGIVLQPDFCGALAQIANFRYFTTTGFFTWDCGADSGVLSYHCLDDRFAKFQKKVVEINPSTFEDIESLLL